MTREYSYIAKSNWSNDVFFNGTVDDFAIYDRILLPEEILCLARVEPELICPVG